MPDWKAHIDLIHPCWAAYRELLARLPGGEFPNPASLNALLPAGLQSAGGKPVRFRPAAELPGVAYEQHVFETGEVSTRAENWHDLFNALAWARFPALKSAMNALHHRHLGEAHNGRRGRQRDALTLLDESGALVLTSDASLRGALCKKDWYRAFVERRDAWSSTAVLIPGHAMLEKVRAPYKAMTAQALILDLPAATPVEAADGLLADRLLGEERLASTKDLSPLPLAGIPGWWPGEPQDAAFYADTGVFRPAR